MKRILLTVLFMASSVLLADIVVKPDGSCSYSGQCTVEIVPRRNNNLSRRYLYHATQEKGRSLLEGRVSPIYPRPVGGFHSF
ncbi:hypothetical protein SAMN06296036_108134 [Pseudobacteriovorax antillogorgiicola]|uniref:Secreted protein n=1 Tax=Pseudobacteriovorax antillogorgiicola TaxID=1513793 RepID=A0A1Y6BS08_9BACT|nr:hypothetical protein EDD56_108113 [Pseudobacteriovorax antillogorgiicola]SMF26321.1 hypothetical protein SAMN06296036_108134 [Pseudobacteriovorax antillogorgiicola]